MRLPCVREKPGSGVHSWKITGINGDASAVTHAAAGNMLSLRDRACPSGTACLILTWDGWNRLTRLSETSGTIIAMHTSDGEPPSYQSVAKVWQFFRGASQSS